MCQHTNPSGRYVLRNNFINIYLSMYFTKNLKKHSLHKRQVLAHISFTMALNFSRLTNDRSSQKILHLHSTIGDMISGHTEYTLLGQDLYCIVLVLYVYVYRYRREIEPTSRSVEMLMILMYQKSRNVNEAVSLQTIYLWNAKKASLLFQLTLLFKP